MAISIMAISTMIENKELRKNIWDYDGETNGMMEKISQQKLQQLYVTLNIICLNKLKMDGMGYTCRNCGEEEKLLQDFGEGIRKC